MVVFNRNQWRFLSEYAYIPGLDFGIFKTPIFPSNISNILKVIGPVSFIIIMFLSIRLLKEPETKDILYKKKESNVRDIVKKKYLDSDDIIKLSNYFDGTDTEENKHKIIKELGNPEWTNVIPILQNIILDISL